MECGFLEDRDIKTELSFLVLSIVVVIMCIAAREVHADIQDGLISYWPLDEGGGTTAYELVNGLDGSLNGDPTWVAGKVAGALDVDGAGDFVSCGFDSLLMPEQEIALQAWVYVHDYVYYEAIVANLHDTGDSEGGYWLGTYEGGYFGWGITTVDQTLVYQWTPAVYAENTWYHLVATYKSGEMRLWVNGSLENGIDLTSMTGNLDYTEAPDYGFLIGRYQDNDETYESNAIIDEVAVWNRALTPVEVDELYNGGSGNPVMGGSAYVRVTESGGGTLVGEAGAVDSYEIVLNTAPSVDVEVTATPSDSEIDIGNGAGAAIVLTFTTENWATPKTVNVSAYDDDVYEGKQPHITTITHGAEGGEYTGINIASVEVEVLDDELICGDWGYMRGDINKDCYVDLLDFAEFASEWLSSEPQ